jgi:hypothetical protein
MSNFNDNEESNMKDKSDFNKLDNRDFETVPIEDSHTNSIEVFNVYKGIDISRSKLKKKIKPNSFSYISHRDYFPHV